MYDLASIIDSMFRSSETKQEKQSQETLSNWLSSPGAEPLAPPPRISIQQGKVIDENEHDESQPEKTSEETDTLESLHNEIFMRAELAFDHNPGIEAPAHAPKVVVRKSSFSALYGSVILICVLLNNAYIFSVKQTDKTFTDKSSWLFSQGAYCIHLSHDHADNKWCNSAGDDETLRKLLGFDFAEQVIWQIHERPVVQKLSRNEWHLEKVIAWARSYVIATGEKTQTFSWRQSWLMAKQVVGKLQGRRFIPQRMLITEKVRVKWILLNSVASMCVRADRAFLAGGLVSCLIIHADNMYNLRRW